MTPAGTWDGPDLLDLMTAHPAHQCLIRAHWSAAALRVSLSQHERDLYNVRARLEAREREMAALELEHQTLLQRLDALQRATGGASSPGDGP